MAYNITGSSGNDTLNQSSDAGPGTIVGLGGNDTITVGTGLATVTGDAGNDSVLLQAGNTGTVNGGSENDSIFAGGNIGSMQLFGSDGADTVDVGASSNAQTIVGGNNSSDGADSIVTGFGSDIMFGNGGTDTLVSFAAAGTNDTYIGGMGDDLLVKVPGGNPGNDLAFGNEGNDSVSLSGGNDTVFLGQGNDSFDGPFYPAGDQVQIFGNEGADTIFMLSSPVLTVVGGNDSADGSDSIVTGRGADIVFGNGGNDTISTAGFLPGGADTAIGGFGTDSILTGDAADLIFANESNDTVDFAGGNNTVFGGQGNDSLAAVGLAHTGSNSIQGNEGNDTIVNRWTNIDTLSGGSGSDVFRYDAPTEDGENAGGGGPVEWITDLDWSADKIDTVPNVVFAADFSGSTSGTTLAGNASSALGAASGAAPIPGSVVAAQFTFNAGPGTRTYLAIDLDASGTFVDASDLLIDITGFTDTIAATSFI